MKWGKKHQELAYYVTSHSISWNRRSKRIYRSIDTKWITIESVSTAFTVVSLEILLTEAAARPLLTSICMLQVTTAGYTTTGSSHWDTVRTIVAFCTLLTVNPSCVMLAVNADSSTFIMPMDV